MNLTDAIIGIIDRFGLLGVCLLILAENIFPPIPSEVILTFGGFLTTKSTMPVWGVIAASTLGAMLGAMILYLIGRLLSQEKLEKLVGGRFGRALRLKTGDIRKAERWFAKHGGKAVLLCRFVPIVRSLISLPAGSAKLRMRTFIPLTLLGTALWNTALVLLGRLAGSAWGKIAHYFDVYSLIAFAVIACICGVIGIIFIKKRFLNPRKDSEE